MGGTGFGLCILWWSPAEQQSAALGKLPTQMPSLLCVLRSLMTAGGLSQLLQDRIDRGPNGPPALWSRPSRRLADCSFNDAIKVGDDGDKRI